MPRHIPSALIVLSAIFTFAAPARAATKPERRVAQSELTDADLKSIQLLFDKLSAAFLAGDVEACAPLLTRAERDGVLPNIEREFQQVQYTRFRLFEILADDSPGERIHIVDARLHYTLVGKGKPNAQGEPDQIENRTTYTFTLRRQENGEFLIVGSPFFETLGMRQGFGVVVQALLALMALIAIFAFCVWMGFEAWWDRPRSKAWRIFVMVPLIGAIAYFIGSYIPRRIRARSA